MTLDRGRAEAVIRKITALRALTVENGATVAEAAAASRMANRLMRKHELTEDRIAPLELEEFEDDDDDGASPPRFPVSAPFAAGAFGVAGIAAVVALFQFTEPAPAEPGRDAPSMTTTLREIAQGAGIDDATVAEVRRAHGDVVPDAGEAPVAALPDDAQPAEDARLAMMGGALQEGVSEAGVAALAVTTISLHFEADAAEAQATRLAELLRREHVAAVEFRPVEIKIARTHVRYFSRSDRRVAQAALALLGDAVSDPAARAAIDLQPRDFSSFTPPPPPNTIEIWMSSL